MYLWGGGSVGLAELFSIPFVLRGQGVWGVCCDNLYLSIFLEKGVTTSFVLVDCMVQYFFQLFMK